MTNDELTTDEPSSVPAYRHRTGDLLGAKYRLERRLGAGGMGEVWLATNVALDLPVAIKLLHADAGDPKVASTRSHLLREARAAAAMSHPAIVRVFDFGRTFRGDSYIVMERLHGEDLRDRLMRSGPLSADDAVRIVLPLAAGLHAAHLRGVVHRDLKPENVFLTRDDAGRLLPKLVDFGLADLRWIDDAERVMAGTPDYMAPEQIAGVTDPDHHVDTWALTCVLFELLTGKAPFDSPSLTETFERIVAGQPSPLPDTVDPRLAAILRCGLAVHREDRFRSSRELGEALARWLMSRGITEDITGQSLSSSWFDSLGSSTTYDQLAVVSLPTTGTPRVVITPSSAPGAGEGTEPEPFDATGRRDTEAVESPERNFPRDGVETTRSASSAPPLPIVAVHTGVGSSGGSSSAGGTSSGGQASGGQASGGQAAGGQASGGQAAGGQASGGQASGGQASGGQASSGESDGGISNAGAAGGGTGWGSTVAVVVAAVLVCLLALGLQADPAQGATAPSPAGSAALASAPGTR